MTIQDMNKLSIRFYKDHKVRAVWNEDGNHWWFSVLDIVGAINQQDDHEKNRNYWKYLKAKLKKENSEVVSDTTQLKLTAPDGKKRMTDVISQTGVDKLAKTIRNQQAMDFLDWFQIHAYLFGGLYDFAGKIRTKTIAKGNTLFCLAEHLHSYLKTVEAMPETTFDEIVEKYVEMNAAHPFMEGNGRSTRIWLDMIFKKRIKMCVDWSRIDKRDYLDAMIASHTDSSRLHKLLEGAMTDKIDDREIFMKGIDYSYYYEQEE